MNYVIFFADELRADMLGCYGNQLTKTPNFDTLASQGVLFEQCHVQHTVCSPSRCCTITGRPPHIEGHRSLWNLIKPHEKNLFGYLKQAGYEVRIYGKNDMFAAESIPLFSDEFMTCESSHETPGEPIVKYGEQGYQNFLYTPISDDYEQSSDYKNLMKGIDFIKNRKDDDKPFILFLPLLYPHCPYTAPEPYYSMYLDKLDDISLRNKGENKPEFHGLIRKYRDLENTDFKKLHAVYMGMTSYTDMLLGKLMDCLEETGRNKDTMLIASADHGDYAGDYDLVEKWPSGAEDVLTRVPLIIKSPSTTPNHRVKEIVELFDIMPTILETENIEITHMHFAKSLVAQLQGEKGDESRVAHCEGGYNIEEFQCSEGADKPSVQWMSNPKNIYHPKHLQQKEHPKSIGRSVMARSLQFKLVRRAYGDHEFYDLQNDPQELVNVYGESKYIKVQTKMEYDLLDWFLNTSDVAPFEEDNRNF